MRSGNAVIVIAVGLLLLYLAITDKWTCVAGAIDCMRGATAGQQPTVANATTLASTAPVDILASVREQIGNVNGLTLASFIQPASMDVNA